MPTDKVALFRAVQPEEWEDIQKHDGFRLLPGQEIKYFARSEQDARKYGEMAEASFGDQPYAVVSTEIAEEDFKHLDSIKVDQGIGTVIIDGIHLARLSAPRLVGELPSCWPLR